MLSTRGRARGPRPAAPGGILYLRSRHAPVAVLSAAGLTGAVWAATAAFSDPGTASRRLVTLTAALAVVALTTTLVSHDDALDRTAARPWPPRRAGHLLGIWVTTTALLALTLPTILGFGSLPFLLRDAAGLTGLGAAGAALLGAQRAWFPVLAWTAPVAAFAPPGAGNPVYGWMVQDTDNLPAALTATGLAAAGGLLYAVRGSRRRSAAEPQDQ